MACCTSLTSISISSCSGTLESADIVVLGQLRSLKALTLRFPLVVQDNRLVQTLTLSPLSSLTNLQQLVVSGLVPEAQGAAGGHCLPAALTSLTLEGNPASPVNLLERWLDHAAEGNVLQQLDLWGSAYLPARRTPLGALPRLRVLTFHLPPRAGPCEGSWVNIPSSVAELHELEVLWISTGPKNKYPWPQHGLRLPPAVVPFVFRSCAHLRKVGGIMLDGVVGANLEHLQELYACIEEPFAVSSAAYPQLQRLVLELHSGLCEATVEQLGSFTQLTSLRLDTGVATLNRDNMFLPWADLEPLAGSLPVLRELELFNATGEGANVEDVANRMVIPSGLSSFTQIKQLRLVCVMDPAVPVPAQFSSDEFYQGLSRLTQLEQLQLEGYSSITSNMLMVLVAVMPQLQMLEVGLCKHPGVPASSTLAAAGDEGWRVLYPGFLDLEQAARRLRPKLLVKVGFARQWLVDL